MSMTLLEVRDLSVQFHTTTQIVHAVRGVSIDIAGGERVGLVGESGSGKTTLALAVMRMLKPPGRISGGSVSLKGLDLTRLHASAVREMRLKRVSYIPQGAMNSLNPVMRVGRQMLDGLIDHGITFSADEGRNRIGKALDGVGLSPAVADLYPHQLSGGMKQRVCIAIAIMLDPHLVIADEPTSALDVISQRQVMKTLVEAQTRIGCGMIIIGHDMGLMAQVTDRIVVMRDGIVVENAPTRRLFAQPGHSYSAELIASVPMMSAKAVKAHEPASGSAAAGSPLLALDGVSKQFGGGVINGPPKLALAPLSLEISESHPRIVAVVGQSGSGKTTLARMVLGLETPSAGSVLHRGRDVQQMKGPSLLDFRRDVQAIFQDPYASFNPFYRVERALVQPLLRFGLAQDHDHAMTMAQNACRDVGLDSANVLGRFPHELSGGQRQRLMVARALALKPRLIVADEPVSMVDASLRMSILANLVSLRSDHGISAIYITHDLATAHHVSDHVIVLLKGRIVEEGPPQDVIGDPRHPYTRALVAAIPWPDPARGWPEISDTAMAGWEQAAANRNPMDQGKGTGGRDAIAV